jgi:hypothetical protein
MEHALDCALPLALVFPDFEQLPGERQLFCGYPNRCSERLPEIKHPGRDVGRLPFHGLDFFSGLLEGFGFISLLIFKLILSAFQVFAEFRSAKNSLPGVIRELRKLLRAIR